MTGILYPPVPSLAQAEDIPLSTEQSGALFRDSLDPFTQPNRDITSSVDEKWDNPTFVTFNTDWDNAGRTLNSKLTPTDSINLTLQNLQRQLGIIRTEINSKEHHKQFVTPVG